MSHQILQQQLAGLGVNVNCFTNSGVKTASQTLTLQKPMIPNQSTRIQVAGVKQRY
jgi:hypothetical protein